MSIKIYVLSCYVYIYAYGNIDGIVFMYSWYCIYVLMVLYVIVCYCILLLYVIIYNSVGDPLLPRAQYLPPNK